MNQMKKVFQCEAFVETGTLGGETAFKAAAIFDWVYSVELSENHFNAAKNRNVYSNVLLYHDSSDHFLDSLLPHIQDKRVCCITPSYIEKQDEFLLSCSPHRGRILHILPILFFLSSKEEQDGQDMQDTPLGAATG